MKPRRFLLYTAGVMAGLGSLLAPGCSKDGPTNPTDNAPVISQFSINPSSIRLGQSGTFTYAGNDDHAVKSGVITDDMNHTYALGAGQPSISGNVGTGPETVQGSHTATITLTDDAGQETKKTIPFTVDAALKVSSLATDEGTTGKVALSDVVFDKSGVSFSSQSPSLVSTVSNDTLRFQGATADVNGTYSLDVLVDGFKVGTLGVTISPMDDISGVVQDVLKGEFIETKNPELIMQGPFNAKSYVQIRNGVRTAVNPDGSFRFPKQKPGTYTLALEAFLTNGTDSSFVTTTYLPSGGDQSVVAKVNSNAGTGISLGLLLAFYQEANFNADYANGIPRGTHLTGVNLRTKAKQNQFYLAGKDTGTAHTCTPKMQDDLANYITTEIYAFLPLINQILIYKAPQGEVLPLQPGHNGGYKPGKFIGLIFSMSPANLGTPGEFVPFDDNYDDEYESAVINLQYNPNNPDYDPATGFEKAASIQEFCSWIFSPSGNVTIPSLKNKTCLHETDRTPYLTGIDKKLLWELVEYDPGTARDDIVKMP